MHIITLLLLLTVAGVVHAEVYKCYTPAKKTVYQPTPCSSGTENKNIVEIEKLNPRQLEEIQNRLKATEAERQALDKAAQEKRDAAAAQWQREAPQREAAAARQEAEAARREATAARQQVESMSHSYPVYIPYPNYYGYHYPQHPVVNPYFPPKPLNPNYPSPIPMYAPQPLVYPSPYMPSPTFPGR